MHKLIWVLALILILSLAACGSSPDPANQGDVTNQGAAAGQGNAAAGKKVFSEVSAPACNTCHSLEPDVIVVGPSLAKMGTVAGSRVPGLSARDYLRQSIVEPNAYIVDGFAAKLMPTTYTGQLSKQEVEDLVAYMLEFK